MTTSLWALRAIVRLELRELWRHRGRSVLVLLLVAVPVAAVVGGATLVQITTPTDEERRDRAMGRAALRIDAPFEYVERQRLRALLPESALTQTLREGVEQVSVPGSLLRAKAIVVGPSPVPVTAEVPAGLASGIFLLEQGTVPRNSGEVALSPALLDALDRSIGQTVTLEYGAERTITGVVVESEALDAALVVRTSAAVEHRGKGYLLMAMNDGSFDLDPVVAALGAAEFEVTERSSITGEGTELSWVVFVLGSIGFLEAGLVVASTFIVGLRRRQYEIGLLGSTGATVGNITSSLLASTGLLATVGAGAGVLVGSGIAAAAFPFLDGWNRRLNGSFELSWWTVVAALCLGVFVALISTVLPSWAAARMPIRLAMGGRRPIRSRSTTWLGAGLGMVGLGILLVLFAPRDNAIVGALAAIVGSIMGVLGFGVSSPFILDALGRRATRLPLRWRLAMRDAGRFRARNGPVVTAVLAGMSMSVTVAVLVASLNAALDALPSQYRSDQLMVAGPGAEAVASRIVVEMSAVAASRLEAVHVHGEPVRATSGEVPLERDALQWIAVGDAELLRTVGGEAALEPLEAGRLVRLHSSAGGLLDRLGVLPDTEVAPTIELTTWRDGRALGVLPLSAIDVGENVVSPSYVLHRSKLEQLGWQGGPPLDRSLIPWLVRLDRSVDRDALAQARQIASDALGVTVDAQLLRKSPARGFYHAVQWLCILTGLVIVLVATALSSAESAADARVLHSVGAAPNLVRGHQAARAGYLAFLGCFLAIPAGLIPAVVLFQASNLPLDIVVPWFDLLTALFALPFLAYVATWLAHGERDSRSGLRGFASSALIVGLLLGATSADASDASRGPSIRWEAFVGEAFDGSPLPGELGRIVVPERHGNPGGGTIELAFVRYRTAHPDPGPPVFFLIGGPGGSGVEHAAGVATHPQMRFLEQADFIGLDQRGTGMSRPDLTTPDGLVHRLPFDRAATRDEVVAAWQSAAVDLVRYWRSRGVDPSSYNSRESADDIDALRRALELDTIVTYGSSYGTHLGLAHLRRHPATVARAILTRVEGPDHTMKFPSTVQAQLESLDRRCRENAPLREALPDLLGTVKRLIEQLEATPVTVRVMPDREGDSESDAPRTVVVGPYDLRSYLSNALSFSQTGSAIPASLIAFSAGDWSALADTALENREIGLELMPWAMDCASGATRERLVTIERQAQDPAYPLGDAILAPHYPEVCRFCPNCDLGDEFRAPITVDVPVLFVSGTLDVRTPPENVSAIAGGFSRHVHMLVENAGHESRELMSPEYRRSFQAFLRGDDIVGATITLPPLLFELAASGGD